jgi:hypothetical protein
MPSLRRTRLSYLALFSGIVTAALADDKLRSVTVADIERLFQSTLVAVERVDHPISRSFQSDGPHYRAERYAINFVDRGCFGLRVDDRYWTIDERRVFVTLPGMDYRCRQIDPSGIVPGACLDVCFSVSGLRGFDEGLVQAKR